jgi:hypothetical protein
VSTIVGFIASPLHPGVRDVNEVYQRQRVQLGERAEPRAQCVIGHGQARAKRQLGEARQAAQLWRGQDNAR